MIGNMTPQLHVHVICRKKGDPDWPGTVWNTTTASYDPAVKEEIINKIKQEFLLQMQDSEYGIF